VRRNNNYQELTVRKRFIGFCVIAVTVSVMALAAQQRPAPGPETTTGGNAPAAPTSPAGSGGLTTGRGRGPAAPQGPTPHLPDGMVDLSGVCKVAVRPVIWPRACPKAKRFHSRLRQKN
jgi:hypothetical protein